MKPTKKARPGAKKRISEIVNAVNAAMDKPVLRRGSDPYFEISRVPTPSLTLDRITGGGFARGRHVEIYGDPSAGKSTVAYGTMALAQQRGEICALIDPEKYFEPTWFAHHGGKPDELLLFQPEKKWNAEDAVGVMMVLADLIDEEKVAIVTVDSVAAMVTQEEMAKDVREGDDRVATQARMMSRALRRITTVNKKTLFLWINQERTNIGFASRFNPRIQPGGRALPFYATTRIEMRKTGKVERDRQKADKLALKKSKVKVGDWIQVRAEKEKSTRPYMQGAYIFDSDKGEIDLCSEILQLGLEDEIIVRAGNKFVYESFDGEVFSLFERGWREKLRDDEVLRDELIDSISDMTVMMAQVTADG